MRKEGVRMPRVTERLKMRLRTTKYIASSRSNDQGETDPHEKSNPTHGSGWMRQILSTMSHVYEALKSHQRKLVDGSDPFHTELLCA